jgi:hypothetical protein
MRTRGLVRRPRVGLLVVLVAALSWGVAAPALASDTSAVALSKPVKVKAAGISLRYPAAWTIVAAGSRKEAEARRKAFLKANPKLAKVYDEQTASAAEANVAFRAGDLEAQAAQLPAANMTITLLSGDLPSTLDEYVRAVKKQLEGAGATLLDSSTVSIGHGSAYRTDFQMTLRAPGGTTIPTRFTQLAIPSLGTSSLLTIGVPGTTDDPRIDAVVGSIRRLG